MMKRISWAILAYLVATPVYANNHEVIDLTEENPTTHQVQTYYKQPNVNKALLLVQALLQQPETEHNDSARLNTWLWSAQVLQQSPRQTRKWCRVLKKSLPNQHLDFAPVFQFANTSGSARCLKSLKLTAEERESLKQLPDLSKPLDLSIEKGSDLDMIWTTFFATGNPKAVYKLIDFIVRNPQKNRAMNDLYATALWSLKSNMQQDEFVKQLVERYVESLSPSQQQLAKSSLSLS